MSSGEKNDENDIVLEGDPAGDVGLDEQVRRLRQAVKWMAGAMYHQIGDDGIRHVVGIIEGCGAQGVGAPGACRPDSTEGGDRCECRGT